MGNDSIRYLIVPGWQGSSDDHWQTHWQNSLPNSTRVEQADWLTPRREDWIAALAEAIAADSTPVILIAHSLGCITVAHWAERAPESLLSQVRGALLVAPAIVGLIVGALAVYGWELRAILRARDDLEEVGRGTHERVLVEIGSFMARANHKLG